MLASTYHLIDGSLDSSETDRMIPFETDYLTAPAELKTKLSSSAIAQEPAMIVIAKNRIAVKVSLEMKTPEVQEER